MYIIVCTVTDLTCQLLSLEWYLSSIQYLIHFGNLGKRLEVTLAALPKLLPLCNRVAVRFRALGI